MYCCMCGTQQTAQHNLLLRAETALYGGYGTPVCDLLSCEAAIELKFLVVAHAPELCVRVCGVALLQRLNDLQRLMCSGAVARTGGAVPTAREREREGEGVRTLPPCKLGACQSRDEGACDSRACVQCMHQNESSAMQASAAHMCRSRPSRLPSLHRRQSCSGLSMLQRHYTTHSCALTACRMRSGSAASLMRKTACKLTTVRNAQQKHKLRRWANL